MFRKEKLESVLQEELGKLIARRVDADAFITITGVSVTKKLDEATVRVAILPEQGERKALSALRAQAGRMRTELLKMMRIRALPFIRFEVDEGAKNAASVEKALLKDDNNG
ncbi:MAG: ribosome-binding factor A [Candidatus Liptonbacteria bacterium]|nr:ribosome-binding factor A [Candidatus Liptonbacteria bacterium]